MSQVLLAAGGTWQLAWTFAVVFVAYALRAVGYGGLGFYDERVLWLLAAALLVLSGAALLFK